VKWVSTKKEIKEVIYEALRLNCGLHPIPVVHIFYDDGEIWISIRRPELYPYDYSWFTLLDDTSKRSRWGLKIAEFIPFTTA
jgi:hypothetical protein